MGLESFLGERYFRLLYTGLILVGVVFVFFGVVEYRSKADIPGSWYKTDGEVVFTEQLSSRVFIPTVGFSLPNDRRIRTAPRNSFKNDFEEGSSITVYYNPMDPQEVIVERNRVWGYRLYLFLGIMFSGMGFRFLVGSLMRGFRILFIREHGKHVHPQLVTVGESHLRLFLNKRKVFFLRCRWENSLTGETYTFAGEPLARAPRVSEENSIGGKKVSVYFIPASPDKYFIEW